KFLENLTEIRSRVQQAVSSSSGSSKSATLVAVSKYKPVYDIQACFTDGQLDFGENYVQELEDKAKAVSRSCAVNVVMASQHWFVDKPLSFNTGQLYKAIPNLYSVNTSGEDSKSDTKDVAAAELTQLARHIIKECPRLRLQGLMTIGALEQSLNAGDENADFERLKETRDVLIKALAEEFGVGVDKWGEHGRLLLRHGMSSDFEAALKAGSDIVRVGTGIFGARHKK
ncbi:hypothetical protein R3P38DRAFT_3037283, partial [Favolaschia claudopus]